MKVQETKIKGLFILENFFAEDERGFFMKTFHQETFLKHNLETHFKESYYSSSYKGVIRGMHFQLPPHDHNKLVYVTEGEILDVVLDLRKQSATFGMYFRVQLKAFSNSIYIPKGCAHGFLTLSERATVVYNVSTVYNRDSDAGIKWNSFGWDGLEIANPILSQRDNAFLPFKDFNSPF
jgi:dTDP-4-dehydrorhamnose 3,5-epimerase